MSVWVLPKDGLAGAAAEAAAAKRATKMCRATAAAAAGDFPAHGRLHVAAGACQSSLNRLHCHQYHAAAVVDAAAAAAADAAAAAAAAAAFLRHSSIQSPSFFQHVS